MEICHHRRPLAVLTATDRGHGYEYLNLRQGCYV